MPLTITAVTIPVTPPAGADERPIVGGVMYPPPRFDIWKKLKPPLVTIPVKAAAVDAEPTRVNVCVGPNIVGVPSSLIPSDLSS